jgi:hypothetical protein
MAIEPYCCDPRAEGSPMKKCVILIALATLVPLAGCVAPYPYDGYYRDGYGGRDYGYAQPYSGYEAHRYDPWADYDGGYDD